MVSSRTFAERLYNCSKFKQDMNYDKVIWNINMGIIAEIRNNIQDSRNASIFGLLYEKLNKWSSSLRLVLDCDKDDVEELLISYAEKISTLYNTNNLDTTNTNYIFKHKINGYILGNVNINGVTYNLDISFKNETDTFYHLYFYKLNFFLYNQVNKTNYNGLVYIVRSNSYYLINYNNSDYTMNRGFVDYNIKSRSIRPGHQCLYCSIKHCKPRYITDINKIGDIV